MNDGGFIVGLVAGALVVSGLCVWGVVGLARKVSGQTPGMQALYILAILFLTMVGLGGLAFSGCVASLSHTHF